LLGGVNGDRFMLGLLSTFSRPLIAIALVGTSVLVALAQQPPTVRVRGSIASIDGPTLMIRSREGDDLKVRLAEDFTVIGIAKTELSEIRPGSYIGVSAMPEPDGTQRALAVHLFPEAQRGIGEGFRPWDLRPGSTMTNATVASTVAGVDGQIILVKYRDGEKKVVVPPGTPIVSFVSAEKSEVKPGANIIIFGAARQGDGTLQTGRIGVGVDGITPPM
jgi:hypothetical protein